MSTPETVSTACSPNIESPTIHDDSDISKNDVRSENVSTGLNENKNLAHHGKTSNTVGVTDFRAKLAAIKKIRETAATSDKLSIPELMAY